MRVEQLGLDRPFMIRSFEYLWNGLTLNLGSAEYLLSDSGSRQVRNILGERLPSTLLLMGTSQLLLFFCALFVALFLSRRYGSFLDKLVIALAPNSAAPAWFYGLFLILIFAALLGWLPYGGMIDAPPPQEPLPRALSIAKHMILPVLSMFIANIFASIYSWRTFFLIYSSEDYVEMAKAKGLSDRQIETPQRAATHTTHHHHQFLPDDHHPVGRRHCSGNSVCLAGHWPIDAAGHQPL